MEREYIMARLLSMEPTEEELTYKAAIEVGSVIYNTTVEFHIGGPIEYMTPKDKNFDKFANDLRIDAKPIQEFMRHGFSLAKGEAKEFPIELGYALKD